VFEIFVGNRSIVDEGNILALGMQFSNQAKNKHEREAADARAAWSAL